MKNHRPFQPFLALLAVLLISISSGAQTIVIRMGRHPGNDAALSGWTPARAEAAGSAASQTPRYVQEIMSTIGLRPNFEVRAANIDNAAAVTYGGKRYILYNPTFINNLVQRTGNKWAAVSVLAHEIGHHLDGHTVSSAGSQPQLELEADEFSGYVLRRMGASLADAQAAMRTIAGDAASATHPGRTDRLASIATGWNRANGSSADAVASAPPPVQPSPTPVAASAPALSILGDLSFDADPATHYYVTGAYNIVKLVSGRQQVLGRLARTNSRRIPYMIYDNRTQLYVQANGSIITRDGRTVGTLRPRNA